MAPMNQTRSHFSSLLALAALAVFMAGCGPNSGPPRIVGQPVNQTAPEGESAIFGVQAQGERPLKYQWRKNGADIYAGTFPNYATPPLTPADNGAKFDVVISNSKGSVTSRAASVTVKFTPPPPPPPPPAAKAKKKTRKRGIIRRRRK